VRRSSAVIVRLLFFWRGWRMRVVLGRSNPSVSRARAASGGKSPARSAMTFSRISAIEGGVVSAMSGLYLWSVTLDSRSRRGGCWLTWGRRPDLPEGGGRGPKAERVAGDRQPQPGPERRRPARPPDGGR